MGDAYDEQIGGLNDEIRRLRNALGEVAALGDRCEDCEPTEAPMATHVTARLWSGIPMFLCDACAVNTREAFKKAESKGCGRQPDVEEHEQDTAVLIALKALAGPQPGADLETKR